MGINSVFVYHSRIVDLGRHVEAREHTNVISTLQLGLVCLLRQFTCLVWPVVNLSVI